MPAAIKHSRVALRAIARRFREDREGGVSTLEFSLLMPFLLAAFIGTMEVSNLIWTRSSVSDAATTVADVTARYVGVDDATVLSIFQASERVVNPEVRAVAGLQMVVSSVIACEDPVGSGDYTFRVIWSHGYSNGALQAGRAIDQLVTEIPQAMGPPSGGTLIFGEAEYVYTLPFGFVLDAQTQNLGSQAYFRPRLSREVSHTGSQAAANAASCG